MFWRYTFGTSSITKLLESPDASVNDILKDGDFLAEVRSRNNKLIDFFSTPERMKEMISSMIEVSDDINFRIGSLTCDAICLDVPEWNRCFHHFPILYEYMWELLEQENPHPMSFSYVSRVIGLMATSNTISLLNFLADDSKRIALLLKHLDMASSISCFERMLSVSEDVDRLELYKLLVNTYQLLPLFNHLIVDTHEVDASRRNMRSKHAVDLLTHVFDSLRQDFPPKDTLEWTVLLEMQSAENISHIVRSIHYLCSSENCETYLSQICSALDLLLLFFDMERSMAPDGHQFVPHRTVPSYSWHYCFAISVSSFKECVPILLEAFQILFNKFPPEESKRVYPNGREVVYPQKAVFKFLQLFVHIVIVECSLDVKSVREASSGANSCSSSSKEELLDGYILDGSSAEIMLQSIWDGFELYPEHSIYHSLVSVMTESLMCGFNFALTSTNSTKTDSEDSDFGVSNQILRVVTGRDSEDSIEIWQPSKSYAPVGNLLPVSETGETCDFFTFLNGASRSQYLLTVLLLRTKVVKRLVWLFTKEAQAEFVTRSAHVRMMLANIKNLVDPSCSKALPNRSYFNELVQHVCDPEIYSCADEHSESLAHAKVIFAEFENDIRFADSVSADPYGYGCDQLSQVDSISQSLGEVQPEDLVTKFRTAFVEINNVEGMLNELQNIGDSVHPPKLQSLSVLCDVEKDHDRFPPDPSTFIPKLPDISISACAVIDYLRTESASNYPPLNPNYRYKEDSDSQGEFSSVTGGSAQNVNSEKVIFSGALNDPFAVPGVQESTIARVASSGEIKDPFAADSVS